MAKATDVVLTAKVNGIAVDVSANCFSHVDFDGAEVVSGDDYYIKKAVAAGATKKTKQKRVSSK